MPQLQIRLTALIAQLKVLFQAAFDRIGPLNSLPTTAKGSLVASISEFWSSLGTAAKKDIPASGNAAVGQVVLGSDSRLTNARTPTAHTHPTGEVTGLDTALSARASADLTNVTNAHFSSKATAAGVGGTTLPTSPGPGWVLMKMPEGLEWVEPIALPSLTGILSNGAGGWYNNTNAGGGVVANYAIPGKEPGLKISPSSAGGDGRHVRTGDFIRFGPSRRVTVVGRMELTAAFSANNGIRAGEGYVNGEDSDGNSSPPSGGTYATCMFDRTGTNSTALYAATALNNTANKVILVDNVVIGQPYTVLVTANVNGSVTYHVVEGNVTYTETNTTYLPPNSKKMAIGLFANRRDGSADQGVIFYAIQAFRHYN